MLLASLQTCSGHDILRTFRLNRTMTPTPTLNRIQTPRAIKASLLLNSIRLV